MTPRLNRLLALEESVRVPDGSGGSILSWVERGKLWAEVRPLRAGEGPGEFVTVSTASLRVIVRAAPVGAPSRPRAEQRFRDGVRIFRIHAVTDADPRLRYLACYVSEEVRS
jgi:head-tail adaptor